MSRRKRNRSRASRPWRTTRKRTRNPVGDPFSPGYPGIRPGMVMALDRMDGIIWTRPVDSNAAWRPVAGERGQHARSFAEATRVLRSEGYRVRQGRPRRRTNPARGPRAHYHDFDVRPGSWVGVSAAYKTWARADQQLNDILQSASTIKQYIDVGTLKVIAVAGPGRSTGYMVAAKAKSRRAAGRRRTNPAGKRYYIETLPGRYGRSGPLGDKIIRGAKSAADAVRIAKREYGFRAREIINVFESVGRGKNRWRLVRVKRTPNFAGGMRYIHNLPPGQRMTRWFAENNPRKRTRKKRRR